MTATLRPAAEKRAASAGPACPVPITMASNDVTSRLPFPYCTGSRSSSSADSPAPASMASATAEAPMTDAVAASLMRAPWSSELGRKLLGNCPGQRIGDDVHVLLHRFPGLRFLRVLPGLELLVLLEVMAAVREQQSVQRVEREIRVGPAEKLGDLGRICGQVLGPRVLFRRAPRGGRLEVLLHCPVVPGQKPEQLFGSRLAVERLDRSRDCLGVGNDLFLRGCRALLVSREGFGHDVAHPENVPHPQVALRGAGFGDLGVRGRLRNDMLHVLCTHRGGGIQERRHHRGCHQSGKERMLQCYRFHEGSPSSVTPYSMTPTVRAFPNSFSGRRAAPGRRKRAAGAPRLAGCWCGRWRR